MYNKIDGGQRNLNNKQNEKNNIIVPWWLRSCYGLQKKKFNEINEELEKIGHEVVKIFAGFEGEIQYMKKGGLDAISYDTVSNFRSQFKELISADRIIISTGYYHWMSIEEIIIPENFPILQGKLDYVASGEDEGIAGPVRYYAYKILRSHIMEWLAISTRWGKFIKEYATPLHEKANTN